MRFWLPVLVVLVGLSGFGCSADSETLPGGGSGGDAFVEDAAPDTSFVGEIGNVDTNLDDGWQPNEDVPDGDAPDGDVSDSESEDDTGPDVADAVAPVDAADVQDAGADAADGVDTTDVEMGDVGPGEPPIYDELQIGTCDELVAPWPMAGADAVHSAWLWSGINFGLFDDLLADMREFIDPECPGYWDVSTTENPWSQTVTWEAGPGCISFLGAAFQGTAVMTTGLAAEREFTFEGFQFVYDGPEGALLFRADGHFVAAADADLGLFDMLLTMHYRVRRSGMFIPEQLESHRDGDFYFDVLDHSVKTERQRTGYVQVAWLADPGEIGDFCVASDQSAVVGCTEETDGSITIISDVDGSISLDGSATCDGCGQTDVNGDDTGPVCGPGLGVPPGGGP